MLLFLYYLKYSYVCIVIIYTKHMNTQTQNANVSKAKQSEAIEVIKQVSEYTIKVLNTNKTLKEESVKLGYCIKQLEGIKIPDEFSKYLKTMKKDSSIYKHCESNIRRSKIGKFTAFYLLQYLYKVTK